MKQIEVDKLLERCARAKRDQIKALSALSIVEDRLETMETLYRDAIDDRDKWERKFRDVLATMEEARESVGNQV